MTASKVSIVIPCYNAANFIQEAIETVIHQTYHEVEIIVIDDNSVDSSVDIIRSFGERIKWESTQTRGAPAARNRGLELANGEFIKFLDADDKLLPDCIERQVMQAQQIPLAQKAIVYGDATWIDQQGQPLPGFPHYPYRNGEERIAHILAQSPLTSCPLHRRDYLLEVGGFDESIPRGQEQDLHLRLALAGVEFVYYPGPVYQYRQHSDPERISNRVYSRHGPLSLYQVVQKQRSLIEAKTGRPLSPEIRSILAKRLWSYGRGVLREGYRSESMKYFQAAKQLDRTTCIVGNQPYPFLVKTVGPYLAESAMNCIRGWSKLGSRWRI